HRHLHSFPTRRSSDLNMILRLSTYLQKRDLFKSGGSKVNRYARQMLFKPIDKAGQLKLVESSVLIVGAGALGGVIANQLVRAGIGKIRLIDRDYVEISNLQRQFLFEEQDVDNALPKAIAAKNKLIKINSDVEIEAIVGNVTN